MVSVYYLPTPIAPLLLSLFLVRFLFFYHALSFSLSLSSAALKLSLCGRSRAATESIVYAAIRETYCLPANNERFPREISAVFISPQVREVYGPARGHCGNPGVPIAWNPMRIVSPKSKDTIPTGSQKLQQLLCEQGWLFGMTE